DETLLNNSNIIELVNTTIKHNWIPTNQSTINKTNLKQAESNKNNNIILACFFSIISLIILTPLFLFFTNRKRRRDNSSK
ncbi:MAG: ATP-dependent Zn protease, partial [Flavobacteriales bacterium]